ncbi:MAG: UDP-N-acetylmuramate--L-alanine ligase [Clostridia bacterium]|nr:UDP-N-acetylmuramate--L-alanine ligase [Clostridia bacterium]
MATENTHYGAKRIGEMLGLCGSVYFIGIGGINMSSLAHLTHRRGYRVGGSDRMKTDLTDRLEREGIMVFREHRAEQIEDYDAVVYTVAISPENPEYVRARERGIPCISRADYMGYLMMAYPIRVGVSGMHGKSSTTSMCAHTLLRAKKDPTVLSGAELAEMGGAYCLGEGDTFVFEACEYMDSFLDFNPTVAVILNEEMDHVDYFKSMDQIRSSFGQFAARTGKDGYAVVNGDDENVLLSLEGYEGEEITFGIENRAVDFSAVSLEESGGCYSFDILKHGAFFCHVTLSVTGRHHVYNALASAAACDLCGLDAEEIAKGLSNFQGAARRMEKKGTLKGAPVYDDYGHHPTEIRATLGGAKGLARGRLICVYQPHTYSRTQALFEEFACAFDAADRVIFMDIYAAREQNEWGVSSAQLAERVGARAMYGGSPERSAALLSEEIGEGDVIVIMGAGDLYKIYDYLEIEEEAK